MYLEDLLIEFNHKGLNSLSQSRVRFDLVTDLGKIRIAVCKNDSSPFSVDDGYLWREDMIIGKIQNIESDNCVSSYPRKNGSHITLNTNIKSNCKGCEFCGLRVLEKEDTISVQDILDRLDVNWNNIHSVGIVTGCFSSEKSALKHLSKIRQEIVSRGAPNSLEVQYIGCQITSNDLYNLIPNCSVFLTIECFERRNSLLHEKKSLTLNECTDFLRVASTLNIERSFLYILGLDTFYSFSENMKKFFPLCSRFPQIQIFQEYIPGQFSLLTPECKKDPMEYFLKAKELLEKLGREYNLVPNREENYRSLWQYSFNGGSL